MNFTSARPKVYDTWTISRYLLPPRSKMTRLSPTKSTVPPNCRFISAGLAQHDRDVQRWVPELKMTGSLRPFEKEYFRKDGSRVPILIGAPTFEEGGSQGVAFVLDLTERRRAEHFCLAIGR